MKINIEQFRKDFEGVTSSLQSRLAQVKLYEFDLSEYAARQIELASDETFASFTKACDLNAQKNGLRSPGFWVGFYDVLIGSNIGSNFELEGVALSNSVGGTHSVMQFLPGSCTKISANLVAEIARTRLSKFFDVVVVNGDHMSNENAESIIKDAVTVAEANSRNVWVISQGMASRSFSVPQIDTVLLTYDGGSMGATLQKLSRALTAGSEQKIGKIISISIDPNREDKVASIILDAAGKFADEQKIDLKEALRRAYATFPLFTLDDSGNSVRLKEDFYLERAMKLDSARSLVLNRSRLYTTDADLAVNLVREFLAQKKFANRVDAKEAYAQRGTRFVDPRPPSDREPIEPNEHARALKLLLEQIAAFSQSLDYLIYFVDDVEPQVSEILKSAEEDAESFEDFVEITGMMPNTVRRLIDERLIDRRWADLTLLKASVKAKAERAN